jgi:hypothetical protein
MANNTLLAGHVMVTTPKHLTNSKTLGRKEGRKKERKEGRKLPSFLPSFLGYKTLGSFRPFKDPFSWRNPPPNI